MWACVGCVRLSQVIVCIELFFWHTDFHRLTAILHRFVTSSQQEAFEKCWAHSPLRAAARRIAIHQVSLLARRTPPAHRCLQRRQRQRVTEGTAMALYDGIDTQI